MKLGRGGWFAFALWIALSLPGGAWAQDVPPASPAPPSADPGVPGEATPTATPPPPGSSAPAAPAADPIPTATPAPAAPPSAAANPNTGTAYTVRLHDLERRVNELKEQIFRSKARLNLLKETVLHMPLGSSDAIITHRNEMGSTYNLIKLVYALDGAEIYAKSDDTGHLGDTKEFEIFNGSIVPGNHTLSVLMIYQGNGYGVFSYIKGYKFTVRSSHTFTAAEGKQTQLKVVGYEQGNPITTDPKDRPAVVFHDSVAARKPLGPNAGVDAPAATPPEANK